MSFLQTFMSPETTKNPYVLYEQIQKTSRYYWVEELQSYFVTHYKDCDATLKDKRMLSGGSRLTGMFAFYTEEQKKEVQPLVESLSRWALFSDGQEHSTRRASILKAFTPRVVETLRTEIENIAESLIKSAKKKPSWDLVQEIAYPLPVLVIGKLLGVPESDSNKLKTWSDDLAKLIGTPLRSFDISMKAKNSLFEMEGYFLSLVQARRRKPENDLITSLSAAGTGMTDSEITATCSMILFAGHETTTNMIGNGMYLLLKNRKYWEDCVNKTIPFTNLTEEVLRIESPAQIASRQTNENIPLEGITLKAGMRVFAVIGAANRDPQVYENPNEFNPYRANAKTHLAFAQGGHFCVGAALSRLEGQIVFEKLSELCPNLRPLDIENPDWQSTLILRCLKEFKVSEQY